MNQRAHTETDAYDFNSAESNAHTAADGLLMDAIGAVPEFLPPRVDKRLPEAILIAAHALIAKLDHIETTHLEALGGLRESLDIIAARPTDRVEVTTIEAARDLCECLDRFETLPRDHIEAITLLAMCDLRKCLDRFVDSPAALIAPKLTEHEKQVIYRALEADYIEQGNAPGIQAIDAALARFKTIAGL